jgi:hypothetical protein
MVGTDYALSVLILSQFSSGLFRAMFAMKERMNSNQVAGPYFRVQFSLSWMGWALTANSLHGLSGPLFADGPTTDVQATSDRLRTVSGHRKSAAG